MAIYICDECGSMLDDDYFPCVEHPIDNTRFCCEGCAQYIEDEALGKDDGDYKYDNFKED